MPQEATASARSPRASSLAKLAKFFPDSTPVRIPVRLSKAASEGGALIENTVIEYGTPHEILFASNVALEFADVLRVQNSDGTLDAEVCVIALQYNGGHSAVAARFRQEVPNWIVKP